MQNAKCKMQNAKSGGDFAIRIRVVQTCSILHF